MNYLDNPKLTEALLKLSFPLADYQTFAQAWPEKAEDIEEHHRMLHELSDRRGRVLRVQEVRNMVRIMKMENRNQRAEQKKAEKDSRDEELCKMFCEQGYKAVMEHYGVSKARVYQIVARRSHLAALKRQQ